MHFEEKKLLKQCLKEVIYEYVLAFEGWWSIFWEVVGSGGYILAGGGWQWVVVDIFLMVVGGGGWWWVVVGCAGSWWMVAEFSLTLILSGQYSQWAKVEAGVPLGSSPGPLLFSIYINDLSENLASNPKLFPDDTSLFSLVKSVDVSVLT